MLGEIWCTILAPLAETMAVGVRKGVCMDLAVVKTDRVATVVTAAGVAA